MNTQVLVVACIAALAVLAHVFGGAKDNASIAPASVEQRLVRNWKQSMCAFQMLAVNLLVVTIVLFTIAVTEIIPFEYELTLFLSILYLLWGIALVSAAILVKE